MARLPFDSYACIVVCKHPHMCRLYTHEYTHTRERENSENRYMVVLTSRQNSVKSVSLRNDSKDLSVGVSTHPHEATMALGGIGFAVTTSVTLWMEKPLVESSLLFS